MTDTTADKDLKIIDRHKAYTMPDDELLQIIQDDWTESEDYFVGGGFFDKFRRWEKLYNLHSEAPTTPAGSSGVEQVKQSKRANNFYGLTTVLCDTVHAIISEALFPVDDFFFLRPTEFYDDEDIREAGKDMLTFDLKPERSDFRRKFDKHLRQAIHYQWSVIRVTYRVSGKNVMVEPSAAGKLKSKVKDLAKKVLDSVNIDSDKYLKRKPAFEIEYDPTGDQKPFIEVLNTFNTRPDPKAEDFDENCRRFQYETEVPWSFIYANVQNDDNPDGMYEESKVKLLEEDFRKSQNESESDKTEGEVQKNVPAPPRPMDMVKLRIWSTDSCEVVTDQNFQIILRKRKKDGWDFKKLCYADRLHRWEGYCVPERCEKHNLEINSIASSRRDNVNMAIEGILVINTDIVDTKKQDMTIYAGKQLKADGDARMAFHFERPPDVSQDVEREIQFVQSWAEKIIGPGDNQQGQYRKGANPTATESEIIQSALSTRMKPIIERIERDDLRWVLKMIMKMEQLYLTDEVKFTVLGPEGVYMRAISPKTLSMLGPDIDVTPIGSQVEQNRFYSRMEKLEAMKVIGSIPQMAQAVNWTKLLRQALETARFRGIDDLVIDDKEKFTTVPPEWENYILQREPIAIQEADDHEEHIAEHKQFMATAEYASLPRTTKYVFEAHVAQHEEAIKQSQQTKPGPKAAPDIFQGQNTANMLSAENPMSQAPTNAMQGMG